MNREDLRKQEQMWLDYVQTDHAERPTSRLHDYTVGVIYDALQAGGYVRIQTEAGVSDNLLRDDVASVRMDDIVEVGEGESPMSFRVDIALDDDAGRTLRVVEVCCWGMPVQPTHFRASMNRAGIEVVRSRQLEGAADVAALVFSPQGPPNFSAVQRSSWVEMEYGYGSELSQFMYDRRVVEFIQALLYCSPELRQQLRHVLDHLDSLESVVPLSGVNPKRGDLDLAFRPNSLERIVGAGKGTDPFWARPNWADDLHSGEIYQALRVRETA